MVATVSSDVQQRAVTGQGVDGVVRVRTSDGFYGTGALLYDGRHVLTARHLFPGTSSSASISVTFETASGTLTIGASEILGMKTWSSDNLQGDQTKGHPLCST